MSAPETELFRAEALAHHARPPTVEVALEREPGWTRWACWGLCAAFVGLVALSAVVRVPVRRDESAAEISRGVPSVATPRAERLLFILLPSLRALAGHGQHGG